MMTLQEQQIAVCEKLPNVVYKHHGRWMWHSKADVAYGPRELNWKSEGLTVCHEAEKLLGIGYRTEYPMRLRAIVYRDCVNKENPDAGLLDDTWFYGATTEQRLEALCRVWWPERL